MSDESEENPAISCINCMVFGVDNGIFGYCRNVVVAGRYVLVEDSRNRVVVNCTWACSPVGDGVHIRAEFDHGMGATQPDGEGPGPWGPTRTGIPDGVGLTEDEAVADAQIKLFESLADAVGRRYGAEFIPDNPGVAHVLKYFKHDHLPEHLQQVVRPFAILARRIAMASNNVTETMVALRKLLESKDAAVRAVLP